MSALKHCPFCGGEALMFEQPPDSYGAPPAGYYVQCKNCDAESRWSLTKDGASKAWNARHSEWISVDTAPKDGTWVIVAKIAATEDAKEFGFPALPPHVWWATKARWSKKRKYWTDGVEKLVTPTHWMPLPEPPEDD